MPYEPSSLSPHPWTSDGQGVGTVANVTVSNNTVNNSLYNAVGFSTSTGIVFENNRISSPPSEMLDRFSGADPPGSDPQQATG